MNPESLKENTRMLASLIGGSEDRARELLTHSVAILFDEQNENQRSLSDFLLDLLGRTFTNVVGNPAETENFDSVIFLKYSLSRVVNSIHVRITIDGLTVSMQPLPEVEQVKTPEICLLLSSCYISAKLIDLVVGKQLPIHVPDPLVIEFADIVGEDFPFDRNIDLGEMFLAGAGAIGNGFIKALTLLNPKGVLYVVDPDVVDDGNLNRCIFFTETDVGQNKAKRLTANSRGKLPTLKLVPRPVELQIIPERNDGAWLGTLITAVDSRRVRRHLQNEIPGRVFDASTTDVREIVLHFNQQPLKGMACLSCVYFNDDAEKAHERHVAEVLGLSVEDVESNFVTNEMAKKILDKYPELEQDLIGLACDSLFKQLCAEGNLKTSEDRQVLAPFSFVSVLAGTYLAIETVKRIQGPKENSTFNYWRISPWQEPVLRGQRIKFTNQACEFCGNKLIMQTAALLWT